MNGDGYIIGPTRLHLPPLDFDEAPGIAPGYGPFARSLCNVTGGGVYSSRFVSFHFPMLPVCAKCLKARGKAEQQRQRGIEANATMVVGERR